MALVPEGNDENRQVPRYSARRNEGTEKALHASTCACTPVYPVQATWQSAPPTISNLVVLWSVASSTTEVLRQTLELRSEGAPGKTGIDKPSQPGPSAKNGPRDLGHL